MQGTIDSCGISYSPDEREELLAEGLVILLELAARYKPLPARPGIDDNAGRDRISGVRGGRFSGYAAFYLPKRLGDAWHRWHPEHRYVTDPATGRRRWQYDQPTMSLDSLYEPRGQAPSALTDEYGDMKLANARLLNDFVPTTRRAHAQPVPAAA